MDCNKDEALKAKQIAAAKMQRGEFVEAFKFATHAKKLYTDIQNISHILTICEVHNAAKKKLISSSDLDWYAILQTQRLADEAIVKKQYKRLALLLHPDKNNFPGAEAAFKLIGQANAVLSDQAKRSLYDNKYGNGKVFVAKHDASATSFKKKTGPKTFWTCCQHCNTRFQFCIPFLNATLRCQKCFKSFKACVVVPSGNQGQKANTQEEGPKRGPQKPESEHGDGGGSGGGTFKKSNPMKKCAGGVGGHGKGEKKNEDGYVPPASRGVESQTSQNVGSKRVRQSAPYSGESFKARKGDEMKDTNV